MTLDQLFDRAMPVPPSGCWVWMGHINSRGYGHVGRHSIVHRVIYSLAKGPIPPTYTIDHLCRVRCCINPSHLEAVSQGVNTLRGETVATRNAAKTHCIRGHAFDLANTYHVGRSRQCRACHAMRERQRRS